MNAKTSKLMLLTFLTSLVFMTGASLGKEKTDWEKEGLKGRVRFCTLIQYEGKEEKEGKEGDISACDNAPSCNKKHFNMRGNIIHENNSSYGRPGFKRTYQYDDNYNLIASHKVGLTYYNKVHYEYRVLYEYKGKPIKKITYNANNNIKNKFYYSYGNSYDKLIYQYDKNGNNIKSVRYSSDGKIKSKTLTKYDTKGNIYHRTKFV